jgi:excisionase family DNA binding protein
MTTIIDQIIHVDRDLLTEKEAAVVLGATPGTLSVWRSVGRYQIPFIKVGRSVRYSRKALLAWLESRTRSNGATA